MSLNILSLIVKAAPKCNFCLINMVSLGSETQLTRQNSKSVDN